MFPVEQWLGTCQTLGKVVGARNNIADTAHFVFLCFFEMMLFAEGYFYKITAGKI